MLNFQQSKVVYGQTYFHFTEDSFELKYGRPTCAIQFAEAVGHRI